jgi:hypothetical protein
VVYFLICQILVRCWLFICERMDGQDVSNLWHQTCLTTYQLEYNSKDKYYLRCGSGRVYFRGKLKCSQLSAMRKTCILNMWWPTNGKENRYPCADGSSLCDVSWKVTLTGPSLDMWMPLPICHKHPTVAPAWKLQMNICQVISTALVDQIVVWIFFCWPDYPTWLRYKYPWPPIAQPITCT